ncbi:MAG: type II secretion protein F [Gammaproteobacteria bacterium]|uniref:Flp pilus assembly protein TadB n=1 Tax=Marinobacter nitratireducens TaxID=1137280 RepID=A0A072MXF0_9GAMM|nr:type II secretion system F family protein [Marinobacter nitratireducens]KEF30084.1 Flp pilus assembly protein TadB [Marinobacter nitratireducens]TNE74010.1 MAG: type II secretion protein F [Gammaproteobacteria bacterium]TNE95923.1 MAG: type II secretion protein F [Gammaproteobacteria bacterium]
MPAQTLFAAAITVSVLTLVVLLGQWVWTRTAGMRAIERTTRMRLFPAQETTVLGGARVDLGPVERLLVQADIAMSLQRLTILAVVLVAGLLVLFVTRGLVELLVTVFFISVAGAVWWRVRFQKQRRVIHEELPGIIDAALRNIDAGRSLEHSLIVAFDESSPVFQPLVFRLRSAVEAGREYTGLFEDFARLYNTPSMILVALALRTTSRFGSSIRPVLEQVAASLRSQQELRQEFLAATAETRFTAVTFAVLPPGLAAYMVLMNEEYADILVNTPTGHNLLITAGILQLIGMAVIWRMIQGVGRA